MTRASKRLGDEGEDRAAAWYRREGYEVVARNWRCRDGELDLIVARGATLVICEVKTRRSLDYGHPAEAVTAAKQARIRRLATRWLAETGSRSSAATIRFDVAAVLPEDVSVIEGAF